MSSHFPELSCHHLLKEGKILITQLFSWWCLGVLVLIRIALSLFFLIVNLVRSKCALITDKKQLQLFKGYKLQRSGNKWKSASKMVRSVYKKQKAAGHGGSHLTSTASESKAGGSNSRLDYIEFLSQKQ